MNLFLSAGMVAWSLLISNIVALADGPIIPPSITGDGITTVGVMFFVVYWMTKQADKRDEAFASLITKSLETMEQKDQRYEAMARECQEASRQILDKLLQIELTRE